MTAEEILKYSGGGLVLLLTLIQIAPIKINPWSWLAEHIGNAFNHTVIEKLKSHDRKFDDMEKRDAAQCRQKILEFNDRLLHKERHSKEYFDSILDTIDDYEKYCTAHPDYPNNKAKLAVENIKEVYKKLSREGGFL